MTCEVCDSDLKQRVDVLKRGSSTPEPGKVAAGNVYELRYRVWAGIRTGVRGMGVRKIEEVALTEGERITHEVVMRYRSDMPDIRDRVRDNKGDLYEIFSVENVNEDNDWLRLLCIKRGSENQAAAS